MQVCMRPLYKRCVAVQPTEARSSSTAAAAAEAAAARLWVREAQHALLSEMQQQRLSRMHSRMLLAQPRHLQTALTAAAGDGSIGGTAAASEVDE
jgi:fructose-1-phosphate kinase PfkB-like protein